jgi:hypothetical protein
VGFAARAAPAPATPFVSTSGLSINMASPKLKNLYLKLIASR